MSDDVFMLVVLAGFAAVIVGIYFVLRLIEDKYKTQVDKARKAFATYSVPLALLLLFGIAFYHDQMGYICNAAGNNTAGWTCTFSWFLIPFLLISIAVSYHYWRVYRKGRDVLAIAGENPRTWSKLLQYSKAEIAVLVVIVLVALLAIFS